MKTDVEILKYQISVLEGEIKALKNENAQLREKINSIQFMDVEDNNKEYKDYERLWITKT